MKSTRDAHGEEKPELSPREARQGRWGKPVVLVLVGGLVGIIAGYAILLTFLT